MPKTPERKVTNLPSGLVQGDVHVQSRPIHKTIAATDTYEPDKIFQEKEIRRDEFYRMMDIPMKVKGRATRIDFRLCLPEVDRNGNATFHEARVTSWGQLRKLVKTKRFQESRLRESDAFATGADMDMGMVFGANNEYHPLMLGVFNRQQYLRDFMDGASKGFEEWNHNPLMHAAVNTIVHFTLGQGPRVLANDEVCQKEWDDFAKRTKFNRLLTKFAIDLSVIGEAAFRKRYDRQGEASLIGLDMTGIWEIVTDIMDPENVFYYHRQEPSQYQMVYHPDDVASTYIIDDIPANQAICERVNVTVGEKRGRGDGFCVLGWGKRFKDFYDAMIINAQVMNSFVRSVTVTGSDADVERLSTDPQFNSVPPPGSTIFQNDKVKQEFMSAGSGRTHGGPGGPGEDIRSIFATGLNMPPEYLGVQSTASSRATALIHAEPFGKFIEVRQQLLRDVVQRCYDFCIATAMQKGRIPQGADRSCEVVLPEFQPEDRSPFLADLEAGLASGLCTTERAAETWAEKMKMRQFDWTTEKPKIDAEKKAAVALIPPMPPSAGGVAPGVPSRPEIPGQVAPGSKSAAAGATAIARTKPGSTEDDRRYRLRNKEKPA